MIYKHIFIGFYLIVSSCGIYSFTGSSIPIGAETFQVNYFENNSGGKPGSTIEPGLDRDFEMKASQNRLTMKITLNYENRLNEEDNFSKPFSFYYDFPGNLQLYDIKDSALAEIFERITQDIFNETLAKW